MQNGLRNTPETTTPLELNVQGKIPEWLSGTLYLSGPGIYSIPLDDSTEPYHITHPFDGLAQIHRLAFNEPIVERDNQNKNSYEEKGRITYTSRHTSKGVGNRIADGDDTLLFFGQDTARTVTQRIASVIHQVTNLVTGTTKERWEQDPSSETVNITVTPNFPFGAVLRGTSTEVEWDDGSEEEDNEAGIVMKTDANMLQLLDRKTLEPKKIFSYEDVDPALGGQLAAAHAQFDSRTGEYFNFVINVASRILSIQTFSLSTLGRQPAQRFSPITTNLGNPSTGIKPSLIHSFCLTEKYIVIPNYPYFYLWGGLSILWYGTINQCLHWDASQSTLFHVLDRRTGRHVATYETDAFFCLHVINAWDDIDVDGDEGVTFDLCAYDNPNIVEATKDFGRGVPPGGLTKEELKKRKPVYPPQVRRYRLNKIPTVAKRQQRSWFSTFSPFSETVIARASYTLVGRDLELPRINPRVSMRQNHFVFGICESRHCATYNAGGAIMNGLRKLNLDDGTSITWDEPNCSCSEPIFVPRPGASSADEDDGVIVAVVNVDGEIGNGDDDHCFIIVLDARNMKELARARMGQYKTTTIHGSFVDMEGADVSVA
ncbi:putative carotene-dioxygenase [Jimgerdemannia flammicorona]|uniref:Putative carotene-dioxygenase n=2 Tax=Jimgerdemannia flammicorona TaxID=994334 RepID=A0A433DCT9_9FUNG|nr:putative carotene-dioxygenase [Jimgerdemannia flammicorona]RUS29857.1 putative carotene-dioxygenase [Jimgerdemannia flammicorona]